MFLVKIQGKRSNIMVKNQGSFLVFLVKIQSSLKNTGDITYSLPGFLLQITTEKPFRTRIATLIATKDAIFEVIATELRHYRDRNVAINQQPITNLKG